MSSNLSPFRIDILDANNNKLGSGPLEDVLSISDTRRLDQIGTLQFTVPASNPKCQYISTGVKFDVYDETDGYLGRYLFKSKNVSDDNGQGVLTVDCYDRLKELALETCGFNRNYVYEDINTIISEVVGLLSDWSTNVTGIGFATYSIQGESILRAVDEIRDRRGEHFRLVYDGEQPVLEFGPFGSVSDINLTQLKGQVQSAFQQNTKIGVITGANIIEESDDIWNVVIPLGAGQGVSQLTIEDATLGDYTIHTGTNDDGSSYFYIQDDDSVTAYGRRVKILSLPQIIPISNSNTNIFNAKNALKLSAEAFLDKNKEPLNTYNLEVVGVRENINVGDKIHARYYQSRNGVNYIAIDGDFWIMDLTRTRNVSGNRSYSINIASVDDRRTSDQDVIIDVVRDLRDINVHIPATLAYSPIGPYTKRIKGDAVAGNRVNADFTIRIQNEVLYLNRALIRFATSPLKSSAAGADHSHIMFSTPGAALGATTLGQVVCADSPGAGGLWNLNLAFETASFPNTPLYTFQASGGSESLQYGVFEDTETPDSIYIKIDGIDRTSALGGPWAVGGGETEVEIEITDYLVDSFLGLQYNHPISFYATDGRGEIEFECDMLCTIQPIAVS